MPFSECEQVNQNWKRSLVFLSTTYWRTSSVFTVVKSSLIILIHCCSGLLICGVWLIILDGQPSRYDKNRDEAVLEHHINNSISMSRQFHASIYWTHLLNMTMIIWYITVCNNSFSHSNNFQIHECVWYLQW